MMAEDPTVAKARAPMRASSCDGRPHIPAPSSRNTLPAMGRAARIARAARGGGPCDAPPIAAHSRSASAPSPRPAAHMHSSSLQQNSAAGYNLKPMEPPTSGCRKESAP